MAKDIHRNRKKNLNLSGLYAVPNSVAYSNGKPREGVYGCVTKNTPYICKAQQEGSTAPPQHLQDMTGDKVPKVLKNRVLAFWSDKNNKSKGTCYLAEKSLYDEMKQSQKAPTQNPHKNGASSKSGF